MPSTGLGVYAAAFLGAALAAGFRADAFFAPAFFATGFFAVFLATFFFAMRGSLPHGSSTGQFAIALHGPGFAAPAHVPEHPLVAAGGDEVAPHDGLGFLSEVGGHRVGALEHRAHDRAEFLGGVGADPAGVERIRRAGALEGLADLPVDPVAGQERGDRLVEGPAVCDREEVGGV